MDESGNVIRNMAQGYTQIEGIDFKKTLAPVAWLEAIQMTLAFTSFKDFKLFQIDVKSAFFNGFIERNCMLNNPLCLLILCIQILFTNLIYTV